MEITPIISNSNPILPNNHLSDIDLYNRLKSDIMNEIECCTPGRVIAFSNRPHSGEGIYVIVQPDYIYTNDGKYITPKPICIYALNKVQIGTWGYIIACDHPSPISEGYNNKDITFFSPSGSGTHRYVYGFFLSSASVGVTDDAGESGRMYIDDATGEIRFKPWDITYCGFKNGNNNTLHMYSGVEIPNSLEQMYETYKKEFDNPVHDPYLVIQVYYELNSSGLGTIAATDAYLCPLSIFFSNSYYFHHQPYLNGAGANIHKYRGKSCIFNIYNFNFDKYDPDGEGMKGIEFYDVRSQACTSLPYFGSQEVFR